MQGIDFVQFHKKVKGSIKPLTEYHITLDMAKEIAMVERNEKGKQARQYFIACEKRLRMLTTAPALPTSFGEALRLAADQQLLIEQQQKFLADQAPKVSFYDEVAETTSLFDMGDVAKMLNTGRTSTT